MRTWAQRSRHTRSYAIIINPSKKRVISCKPGNSPPKESLIGNTWIKCPR